MDGNDESHSTSDMRRDVSELLNTLLDDTNVLFSIKRARGNEHVINNEVEQATASELRSFGVSAAEIAQAVEKYLNEVTDQFSGLIGAVLTKGDATALLQNIIKTRNFFEFNELIKGEMGQDATSFFLKQENLPDVKLAAKIALMELNDKAATFARDARDRHSCAQRR